MKIIRLAAIAFLLTAGFFLLFKSAKAVECGGSCNSNDKTCLSEEINSCEQKLNEVRQQKNTLSSQIGLMDTQITLTGARIRETEYAVEKTQNEIESLGEKIEGLNTSLDYLGKVLLKKIVEGYKRREMPFLDIFLDSKRASALLNRLKYAKTAEENDRRLAFQVQQAKQNFEEQKSLREKKKIELDNLKVTLDKQKVDLANQKTSKQKLLSQTQNDEARYQSLLASARAEQAAIQGIIAGAGTETVLREVKKGDTIASVIPGPSCNSGGAHLHFIVNDGGVKDPFGYLKPVDYRNCSGSSCGSGDGDSFSPSGSWDWPLNPSIELEQGYGSTWAVRNSWVGRIYSFHNGIDINGASNSVFAVADGTLYRGSYSVGCPLSYAKVKHTDGKETLYLHTYVQ